ncbi:MAG: AAA-like domain-containing protein [Anaerolineae bacterium]|nr:AAA-like domain-containing protein [Anaerolineae bacterium]
MNIKQTIFGALSNLGSTCVVGERRTGKTSLLLDIHRRIHAFRESQSIISIYMDCSDFSNIEDFWKDFIANLKVEASGQITHQIDALYLQNGVAVDIESIADRILKTITITHSIVMLLDEFDYVLENEAFAGNFLLRLRKYGSLHNVAYVTASRQRLETHYSSPTPSPFFNIFLVAILGLFPENEARDLLNKTLEDGNPVFNENEIVHLLQVSGCYPYFLQLAASILFTMKYGDEEIDTNWREIHLTRFDAASRQHFDYFWKKSSDEEKELLGDLSSGEENIIIQEETVKLLMERSLVKVHESKLFPFSPVWSSWVLHQVETEIKQSLGRDVETLSELSNTQQVNDDQLKEKVSNRKKQEEHRNMFIDIEKLILQQSNQANYTEVEANMTDKKTIIKDIHGSIVNVESLLENVTQTISAIPYADSDEKDKLAELVNQFKQALKELPPDKQTEAQKLSKRLEALINEANDDEPEKDVIEANGNSLLKAAKNVKNVVPTVLAISKEIITFIIRMASNQ